MRTSAAIQRAMSVRHRLVMLAVFAFLGVAALAPRPSAAASDPTEFIRQLGESALHELTGNVTPEQREKRFRELFEQNFDVPAIGRFVLGRYWNTATPAERDEFLKLFEDLVVQFYSGRFGEYSGEHFEVEGVRDTAGNSMTVHSRVVKPNASDNVRVDWRIRRDAASYRIVDVMVEGVSMAVTQRAEFASVIQSKGGKVSGLIETLRAKTAAPPAQAQNTSQ